MREQARLARQEYSDAVLDVLMVGHRCVLPVQCKGMIEQQPHAPANEGPVGTKSSWWQCACNSAVAGTNINQLQPLSC